MHRKELFYFVTWGSNVTRDVHWCITVSYQQIENSNIANQIHGFTIDYGKFILIHNGTCIAKVLPWFEISIDHSHGNLSYFDYQQHYRLIEGNLKILLYKDRKTPKRY